MPSQQADGSTVYVLSPLRSATSTPNSLNPQVFQKSLVNAHHQTVMAASSGESSHALPFSNDTKDQIPNFPGAYPSLAEIETPQVTPKKKRRRRKKDELASSGDGAVVSSSGTTDLELNPSVFMSPFHGGQLPLGLFFACQELMLPWLRDASYSCSAGHERCPIGCIT